MDSATLNKRLDSFSKELKPPEDFFKIGNETADRIFRLLKEKGKIFSIDRVKIAGSIGKSSAVCVDPDYDMVVFVNGEHPYFEKVISNFEDILLSADMDIRDIDKTQYSLQFNVNGIPFDLLPATNFVTENPQPGGSELARLQANRTMEYIERTPGFGYKYGSAVCEQQVEFLKGQTPFVHQVVRLAKFWNKTLSMGTYISGRSTLIELIGIHAAKMQEAQGQRSYLEGFEKFLELIKNFDTLCVKFCGFYTENEIPNIVNKQRPLVLDPVNRYNNFAYFGRNKRTEIIKKFKEFAQETMNRINHCQDLNQLFEVQPKIFVPGGLQPQVWSITTGDEKLINPKMKVNMDDKKYKEKNWNVKDVQQRLMTTIAAASLGGTDVTAIDTSHVKRKVKDCIDVNILGMASPGEWKGKTFLGPNDFDVRFSIPNPVDPNEPIIISASFESQGG